MCILVSLIEVIIVPCYWMKLIIWCYALIDCNDGLHVLVAIECYWWYASVIEWYYVSVVIYFVTPNSWLTEWLLTEWFHDWMIIDRTITWLNEWLNEIMFKWKNVEWFNVNEWNGSDATNMYCLIWGRPGIGAKCYMREPPLEFRCTERSATHGSHL